MGDSPRAGSFRNNGSDGSGSGKKVMTLDPLGEEDGDSDSESEDELAAAKAATQAETNKFEMLCDGVLNSIALVQAALAEFLNLKDELLLHALPPSLMARLTMIAGRLFRSTTDLYTPTSELVRLVRVYSGSWEEKSLALKKLHSDYESKHKQLNIAIRRLQLADAQAKRIEHEKRIMNWEKLFAKLTSSRGHGRRWRFLIDNFKQKSKLGMEHLHAYIDDLDREEDSENEEEEEKKEDSVSHTSANEFDISSSDELEFTEEDSEEEDEDASTARATAQTGHTQQDIDSDMVTPASKKVKFRRRSKQGMSAEDAEKGAKSEVAPPATIVEPQTVYVEVPAPKPPSADKVVWTHEPEYDYTLNVRLYKPVGLDHKELKCSVNFKKKFLKTDVFEDKNGGNGKSPLKSALKPKSMIGSKGSSAASRKDSSSNGGNGDKKNPPPDTNFHDVAVPIGDQPIRHDAEPEKQVQEPDEKATDKSDTDIVTPATSSQSRPISSAEEPMRIAVHSGTLEDMVAMGTVGMEDLHSMDIEIVEEEEKLKELRPSSFPLYPISISHKDRNSAPIPCGNIPMAFYYTRVHRPFVHDKETESETVTDIVLDLTGVDLSKMKKEDLSINKIYEERCLSALSILSSVSSEKPEMVPRAEVDVLVEQHNQELSLIQEEYEQRLNELAKNLEQLQNDQLNSLLNPQKSSDGHRRNMTSPLAGWATDSRITKSAKELRPVKSRSKRPANLPDWGSDLPKDFFERLKLFSEESEIRRRQLIERTKSDMEDRIVKQLAGQYKINLRTDSNADANKEVCLPAIFMPTKTGQLYNPRAHSYFHPTGSLGQLRLTQPPSMFQLPPLPNKNRVSVINLFDIRKNFEQRMVGGAGGGGDWIQSARSSPTNNLSQPNTPLPSNMGEASPEAVRPVTE
ncbi:uncharacterized protein LOC119721219 isoform X2 [Patiria miniata]|uniref:Uncharacterized protein n=1 Tax=Patiria miniata TaxID=46514 RepID=A0A913Z8D0_PATMI|nr:uncharacterized protein LOC119721219 isoform X1 [Patiria miniata]XP_038047106.1 uncharacterized protein LOC119721219 isoform X2 [Patiria miniata]